MIHPVVSVQERQSLCDFPENFKNFSQKIVPEFSFVRRTFPSVVNKLLQRFSAAGIDDDVAVPVFRRIGTLNSKNIGIVLRKNYAVGIVYGGRAACQPYFPFELRFDLFPDFRIVLFIRFCQGIVDHNFIVFQAFRDGVVQSARVEFLQCRKVLRVIFFVGNVHHCKTAGACERIDNIFGADLLFLIGKNNGSTVF